MGDYNQYLFVERHQQRFQPPFLEVGSKNYGGSTQPLRPFWPGAPYVGVDMEAGEGVDVVLDLTQDFATIDRALGGQRFGTIFCFSVLEHCQRPWVMAETLTRLLAPGGQVCLGVPWAWQFHGYPNDYWRFTHEGVKLLFPELEFDLAISRQFSSVDGEEGPLDQEIGVARLSHSWHRQRGHWGRAVGATLCKALRPLPLFRWLVGYPYVMVPTNLTMVGTRRA